VTRAPARPPSSGRLRRWLLATGFVLAWTAAALAASPDVTVHPARLRVGDIAWVHVRGIPATALVEGTAAGRPLRFFPYEGGQASLLGIDLDLKAGWHPWRLTVVEAGQQTRTLSGRIHVEPRDFPVQRLTLPQGMVDLDPATERRATAEGERLREVYRVVSPERLWRGPFQKPVVTTEPGGGFGSRRVINGKPRAAHSGLDWAAPGGTPVTAVNNGVVALVGEFFFPGRLVVLDHGLGLYTLYFHLDMIGVVEGERVERGQALGTVGATGRATGPHLHFGVQVGPDRVDPAALFGLALD
jgi:murein DD-endopeptidase MepM/ murein hydrolase activator NlpD